MPTSEERILELEKEVKRLSIKLESLVNHLAVAHAPGFAAPVGRTAYDMKVGTSLAQANL
jgi:hypothetical protein